MIYHLPVAQLNRRFTEDGRWELEEREVTDENEDFEGIVLPDSHFRNKRDVIDKVTTFHIS